MQGLPHHYHISAEAAVEGGVAVSGNLLPTLDTQPPPEFGGPEGHWSPETLLTASVADCFILSFRAIARASKFDWNRLECSVEGILDRVDRVTQFTCFNIDVVLHVAPDARLDMAQRLLEKAKQACLVTNSLNSETTLKINIKTS